MFKADVQVLHVSRYNISNDDGRPPVKGTKIYYLAPKVSELDSKGSPVVSVNGPYELFDKIPVDRLPGKFSVTFGQKMSSKKAILTLLDIA